MEQESFKKGGDVSERRGRKCRVDETVQKACGLRGKKRSERIRWFQQIRAGGTWRDRLKKNATEKGPDHLAENEECYTQRFTKRYSKALGGKRSEGISYISLLKEFMLQNKALG